MVEYHVVVSIQKDVESDWLQWMQDIHIPDVLHTGYFLEATLLQEYEPPNTADHTIYHVRYLCSSHQQWEDYQKVAAPALQAEHRQRYHGRFQASRSVQKICYQKSVG